MDTVQDLDRAELVHKRDVALHLFATVLDVVGLGGNGGPPRGLDLDQPDLLRDVALADEERANQGEDWRIVGEQPIPIGVVADLDRGKDVGHTARGEDVLDLDDLRARHEFPELPAQHPRGADDQKWVACRAVPMPQSDQNRYALS